MLLLNQLTRWLNLRWILLLASCNIFVEEQRKIANNRRGPIHQVSSFLSPQPYSEFNKKKEKTRKIFVVKPKKLFSGVSIHYICLSLVCSHCNLPHISWPIHAWPKFISSDLVIFLRFSLIYYEFNLFVV